MKRTLVLTLPLLLLAACGGSSTIPEDHYYRLPPAQGQPRPAALAGGPIFVEQFIADGIQRERALVYAEASAPEELLQYHYQFWTDSPARLLRDQLIDYLRAIHAATLVTDSPDVPASLSIYGKIKGLDQVVSSASSQVFVSIEFRVQRGGADAPILIREYQQTRAPADRTLQAVVDAYGDALSAIYAQLADDIAALN